VGNDQATIIVRAIPLSDGDRSRGALVLLRDVTDLRRRDRELVTKDATIREIHHRVKNNLQTVAALLRLQARRTEAPEARSALEEAVRRVGSIALVHETLSHSIDETVAFDEIADRLRHMVTDLGAADATVRTSRRGSFGTLPGQLAASLAMVLTELLQNATEHGFAGADGHLEIVVERTHAGAGGALRVTVCDDGKGLPDDFDPARSRSLGLSIVRTLVESELGGELHLSRRTGGGTEAAVLVPLP
jgi:two-component sensor histidine kinase